MLEIKRLPDYTQLSKAHSITPMPKLIDQKLLSENPMVAKYAALRKASRSSKPVSRKQAMEQISRYSREQRPNVYKSTQESVDGILIFEDSPEN